MGIKFEHNIDGLAADLRTIAVRSSKTFAEVVRDSAREGNKLAQAGARRNRGRGHARKYAGTFSAVRAGRFEYQYGPRPSGQGLLANILENAPGRARNRAQNNLAKSADVIGPKFGRAVLDAAAEQFWPGGEV